MSNPLRSNTSLGGVFVFDPAHDEIQEWDIDEVIYFLNQSSDLYFSLDKDVVKEQKRLYKDE